MCGLVVSLVLLCYIMAICVKVSYFYVKPGLLQLSGWASHFAEQLSTALCTQQALSISNIYWKMDWMDGGREALTLIPKA